MPEPAPGTEPLKLKEDFPPVPTAEWEAAIQKDLKGADYQKKLVWRTDEGIAVRPYYRAEDLKGLEGRADTPPLAWEADESPAVSADAIRADELHEAGANAVQELGYALAAGVEKLAGKPETREVEFVFAVGSTYFMEIAKLRAARLLWAQASAAFGGGEVRMRLNARTSRRNKSVYDVYTNLLRATTEALSAAVGGCERLYVEPYGFEKHLAINVQRILREESHVDAVADPAGGSYYIEMLTDALAREAWKLFQQVEAEGGYSKATASGSMERALDQSRAALRKGVAMRRKTLVGVNNFPNLKEKSPAAEPLAGAAFRMAEPFERIRERTERHAKKTGRYPKVLLLKHGDVKMRMARANFSLNFFGCAGFDIESSVGEYAGTKADLIVLCSSDPEYLVLAQEVCPKVKVPVIVAGNPKDQIDALRAAGVQGFVHVACDAVATLSEWQDRLGMEA
jgi:methylmalonyl-CoA mutase